VSGLRDVYRRGTKAANVVDAVAYAARHRSELGRPVLYDVGGRGGLHRRWAVPRHLGLVHPVLFEPDPDERARLAEVYGDAQVIGTAVADVDGQASMFVTAEPGCSSLLEPDESALRALGLTQGREVLTRTSVNIRRIDSMISKDSLPLPTYLKLDVQGSEKRALDGMGDWIHRVVAIELESRLVSVYQGETLLPEMIDFLRELGFGLLSVRPLGLNDGAIIEVNAYFARMPSRLTDRRSIVRRTFWRKLMGLPTHRTLISASS
jgi:FkbM family methyltransferase